MMFWVVLACNAMCIFAFSITPFVTRKTELFGVSLPSAEIGRPELSALRRAYLLVSLLVGAVLIILNIVLFRAALDEFGYVRWFLVMLFTYIAIEFLIYLYFHKRMKKFKEAQPWRAHGAATGAGPRVVTPGMASMAGATEKAGAENVTDVQAEPVLVVDTEPPKRDVLHPAWLLLLAVIGIITLLYLLYIWPSLPDRMPIHMDAAGVIDGWADKTPGGVVTLLFVQWIIIGVFALVYLMIPLSKRQIDASKPLESREQGRRFRYTMSACLVFSGAALAAILGFFQISFARGDSGMQLFVVTLVTLILIFAVIVVMLVVMFRVGQGGSKLRVKVIHDGHMDSEGLEDPEGSEGANSPDNTNSSRVRMTNTDDDVYWKLGQFYFNPKDPAVFVEKRFGLGWTINFGHVLSWLFFGGLIAVIVVSMALVF
jgi:uncharacterized membrane protein